MEKVATSRARGLPVRIRSLAMCGSAGLVAYSLSGKRTVGSHGIVCPVLSARVGADDPHLSPNPYNIQALAVTTARTSGAAMPATTRFTWSTFPRVC